MRITNEHDRITYLPESRLFSWLESVYTNEIEWRTHGNPHETTAAALVAELEGDQFDPLDHDWNGLEDSQLSTLWADLGYPLPTDADEMANAWYGTSPSDIARQALREYANMYDVEATAAVVLERLQAQWNEEQSHV